MSNLPAFWRGSGLFREMDQMQQMMDRLFEGNFPRAKDPGLVSPAFELTEDNEGYIARFELPGLSKDQIKVELHDNRLTVSAERKSEVKDEKKRYSEFTYGSFLRTFTLPTPVSEEKVNAAFENGVLTVRMAKAGGPAGARQISVK